MILGLDWGSSSVRAMRIGDAGEVLEVRRSDDGVFARAGDFEARARAHLGDWLGRFPSAPILMCGMIGSDRGWVHAPYVRAPAGLTELAGSLCRVPLSCPAYIVPGISYVCGDDAEVMRGEETLVAGLLEERTVERAVVCLPGTHSKWVDVAGGRITGFRTYMTGELRALVLSQGALATTAVQQRSTEAFASGLEAGRNDAGLSRSLFQGRARRLLGGLAENHVASFVGGVLIGAELAQERPGNEPLFVVARGSIAEDYHAALAGGPHELLDPEVLTARGLARLARLAGFLATG